jgi:hypothetical protein
MPVLAVALGLAIAPVAHGAVTKVGTLSPSGGPLQVTGLASADGTLLAAGTAANGGAIDVFTEPVGGWSSESQAATLVDPIAVYGPFAPSLSGATVVANATAATGLGFDDVFIRPADGWAGTVLPAARLVAPAEVSLGEAVVSGRAIVARAMNPQGSGWFLYVFVEPAGGWTGTVAPVAVLMDSAGADLHGGLAFSKATVFAGATASPPGALAPSDRVDVFAEPAAGWAGTVHESATAVDASGDVEPVEASGSTVLDASSVFHEPASGWRGIVRPVADIYPAAGVTAEAFSGEVLATSTERFSLPKYQCPCHSEVSLLTEPPGGWWGTMAGPATIEVPTDTGLAAGVALQGRYLFTSGGSTVGVYDVSGRVGRRPGPPRVAFPFVSGLASGKPQFSFTMTPKLGDPPLASFTLTLPRGLAFTHDRQRLRQAVSIAGAGGYTLASRQGALLVRLTSYGPTLALTVRTRALWESKAMAGRAQRLIRHAHTRPLVVLRARLHTSDRTGADTNSIVRFLASPPGSVT